MKHLITAHAWIVTRTGGTEQTDRGDNPIPTSIIIAGLSAFALAVVLAVTGTGQRFLDAVRNMNP